MVPYYLLSIFALQVFDLAAALPNYGLRRQVSNNGTVGDGQVQLDISNCPGYTASKVTTTESSLSADLTLAGTACNVYGDDLKDLKLLVEYQTDNRLHVKIYDAGLQVYQVQESVFPRPKNGDGSKSSSALEFTFTEKPFTFTVVRKENKEVLFDTSDSPLIFESQYVRLRTKLPDNPNLYGLGEHSDSFRLETENYRRTLWNAEAPMIPRKENLYGSHPVYFDHRGDKGTHGVFLLNANGMDININKTAGAGQFLEYNTVGGIIDLYFMAGKKPADVSAQYAEIAGLPAMIPYWTLGFHQCKYGYWDVNYVAEVVGNYSTAGIPLEVMWTDIDYMNLRQDFTVDPERFDMHKMRLLIETLHKRDQKYMLILDPAIHRVDNYSTYKRGKDLDIFLKSGDGSDYLGIQWAGVVAWPDWLHPKVEEWWTNEFKEAFNPETGLDVDAIWIDMNEGSNFCKDETCVPDRDNVNNPPAPQNPPRPNTGRPIPGFPKEFQPTNQEAKGLVRRDGDMKGLPNRDLFFPKYKIKNRWGSLSSQTLWTNTSNYDGTHQYDTHNLHGLTMAINTRKAMLARRPSLRPMVLTRSTWAGTGRHAAHWFGDNNSTWADYLVSMPQAIAFSAIHQIPMVGSDVCGFNGVATEDMCARWALLGAFQPFYRNHADITAPPQEFYIWEKTKEAAKIAINTRYKLLDYIYTAMHYQTTTGKPLVQPLWFLYPSDATTFPIQYQYFFGDSLLVAPVTTENSNEVAIYFPKDTFYDFWTYLKVSFQGTYVNYHGVRPVDIPVFIRGSTIIPMRSESANTTTALRGKAFTVLVAPGSDGKAEGRLYLDDGVSLEQAKTSEIKFSWDGKKFSASGKFDYEGADGESVKVTSVLILGQDAAKEGGEWDQERKTITVKGDWTLNKGFEFELK